jgi:hypothetical protein
MAMAEAAIQIAKEKKARAKQGKKRALKHILAEEEDRTHIGFIDLRKAYDMVDRDVLLAEMLEQRFPPETIAAAAKLMNGTSFAVEDTGESVQSLRGVQ